MNLPGFLARNSTQAIYAAAILIVLAIGWVDWFTGSEIGLFALYSLPIFLAVWYVDKNAGIVAALLSAFVWWWANKDVNDFTTPYGYPIATGSRLACFIIFAFGGAALKAKHEADHARIEALQRAGTLEREIVGVSEREQRRIGRDLHDGLCQMLAAIGCAATSLKDDLQPVSPTQAAAAGEIEELLNEAVVEARNLARGLSPVDMAECGLAAALNDLAERTSRLTSLSVSFESFGEFGMIDPDGAVNLYRIAQEATHNAVRHSRANHIEIALIQEGQQFNLSVTDDGVGVSKLGSSNRGMGMQTMSYRAQIIGAELTITGNLPSGTCVSCSFTAEANQTNLPTTAL